MIPRVDSNSLPKLPNLPSSDARWLNSSENAAISTLMMARSSSDAIHDKLFIPAIASIGVLMIICVFCCYKLIINKDTVYSIGALPIVSQGRYNEPPILHSQHAVGRQENSQGGRPLSRGFPKATRKPPHSLSTPIPGSPSVHLDTVGYHHHLQQQRQQLEQQQQDPYRQYDYGHPWPHHQRTPHPSATVQRGEGVQPQPHSVRTHATPTIGPDPAGDARNPSVTIQPPLFTNAVLRPGPMYPNVAPMGHF